MIINAKWSYNKQIINLLIIQYDGKGEGERERKREGGREREKEGWEGERELGRIKAIHTLREHILIM